MKNILLDAKYETQSIVSRLKENALINIVGDVHGELEALKALIKAMGYNEQGVHPDGRMLVFVGDLVDRGPDSPGVVRLIQKLVENGRAAAVLGNHELNLLQGKPKDGAGWFFESRYAKDKAYAPFERVTDAGNAKSLRDFLVTLPVALERSDLRVVHAAWDNDSIDYAKKIKLGSAIDYYDAWESAINEDNLKTGLLARYEREQAQWCEQLEDKNYPMKFLKDTSDYNLTHQMLNPLRILTSGVERVCETPFFASGKWRFVDRFPWWSEYNDKTPVVMGHYWRKMKPELRTDTEADLFDSIDPYAWHGARSNVFCVDFSVGGRFVERNNQTVLGTNTQLVALSWPERTLTFEDGRVLPTLDFGAKDHTSKIKI